MSQLLLPVETLAIQIQNLEKNQILGSVLAVTPSLLASFQMWDQTDTGDEGHSFVFRLFKQLSLTLHCTSL